MIGAPFTFYLALLGLLGGFVIGFVARRSNFCTLGAIEETYYGTERSRLRTWVLAIGVAVLGTQVLQFFGIIDLSQSIYLEPELRITGAVLGGMSFGLGMALVGTCAFGMLLRAGGGDMRSLVSTLVLGIVGYMTANGLFSYLGLWLVESGNVPLADSSTSAISDLIFGSSPNSRFAVALVLSGGAIGWALYSRRFLANRWAWATGLIFGLVIVYGWLVTGLAGQDGFEQVQLESYRFARPMGDTLVYAMTFSGAAITFPIGGILGVLLGAFLASMLDASFRFEAFDDPREMRRHFGGSALMGFGSVLALGCTIGQGMTGVSTLSINSFLTVAAIAFSAWLGIRYLIEGEIPSLGQAISVFFKR